MSRKKSDSANYQASGLRFWMERVLDNAEAATLSFDAERVHDLRTALRRCRSMAAGLKSLDPDKTWRLMTGHARQLFRRLGELRDVQVMIEHMRSLAPPGDAVAAEVLSGLALREADLKQNAMESLQAFDRDKWKGWIGKLDGRARRVPLDGIIFRLSALKALKTAHDLHRQALRNRSSAAFHRLRIALKKFRYTVENFLPLLHEQWGQDLKMLQDCLGEEHDLAILQDTVLDRSVPRDGASRTRWRGLLRAERSARIEKYRQTMVGDQSLWNRWRQGLPAEDRLPSLSLSMIKKAALFRGADPNRIRMRRSLALQLFSGLQPRGARRRPEVRARRAMLHAASILCEAGRAQGRKKGGAGMLKILDDLSPIPGFNREMERITALIARCQRQKPSLDDKALASLGEENRQIVVELAGILRLARALARNAGAGTLKLRVRQSNESIVIQADGFTEFGPEAERMARARYWLEYARRQPIVIRGADSPTARPPASLS